MKNITIDNMLADETLRRDSEYVQSCVDWNRHTLKEELGLTEQDIIDIPQLFMLSDSRADAFFPNMFSFHLVTSLLEPVPLPCCRRMGLRQEVNMMVLGKHLGIAKPFGPIVNGQCCLEEKVRSLLEPLGLICTFINDFFSYHILSGEVHCGTNVRRKPFSFKWWNMIP